jgi:pimeloyl-ACP methyl ester carboxylesterase
VEAVAEGTPDAPLVLLLHGFPEFWWAWRDQLPALAEAGYRAVAMDLRGYGGSDKTPRGYDPLTLARDVAGVVKALGERSAVLVGQGWGGYVGWATAALHPREVSALCAVSAPHPRVMLQGLRTSQGWPAFGHVLSMQMPMLPERKLSDPRSGYLHRHLVRWSSPVSAFPDDDVSATYQRAFDLWPAPHCALEYHRWLVRSRFRFDGRHFSQLMARPLAQPVCLLRGGDDPAMPARLQAGSVSYVDGPCHSVELPGTGHFPHEEDPPAFNAALLAWLRSLEQAG